MSSSTIDLYLKPPNKGGKITVVEETIAANYTKYTIGERLACGGNGVVHACSDNNSGEEFAIKFQLMTDQFRLKRFKRETELTSKLQHNHLIQWIAHGEVDGVRKRKTIKIPFLIMELADRNLFDEINKNKAFIPYETYIAQFKGIAEALGMIHNYAVHRDIKPHNILISGERWVLSDYGLCNFLTNKEDNLTPDWQVIGPRYWMSPEANNKAVGHECNIQKASDVYQLAAVFWYVVLE